MADRRQIEAMIKKKEQEIQMLEMQLKDAGVYLHALQDVLKKFPREASVVEQADTILRPGSLVALAREIILKHGAPLHVDLILSALGREQTRENKTALGGSLSAYVRKGVIFLRTGPNTFGLVELAKRNEGEPDPPAGFGWVAPADVEDDPF